MLSLPAVTSKLKSPIKQKSFIFDNSGSPNVPTQSYFSRSHTFSKASLPDDISDRTSLPFEGWRDTIVYNWLIGSV
jgi:hypothetical protein